MFLISNGLYLILYRIHVFLQVKDKPFDGTGEKSPHSQGSISFHVLALMVRAVSLDAPLEIKIICSSITPLKFGL